MRTADFLRLVLPANGIYCGAKRFYHNEKKQFFFQNLPAADIPALEAMMRNIDQSAATSPTQVDAYFALASFKEAASIDPAHPNQPPKFRRKASNVKALRALWIDLDVDRNNPQKYLSQKAAAEAVLKWCLEAKFPKPMLVSSGGGIHAYWPLGRDVTPDEWWPLAHTLRMRLNDAGIKADPAAWDVARVLRPVGTHNHKSNPPRLVKVVIPPDQFSFAELVAAIGPTDIPPSHRPMAAAPNKLMQFPLFTRSAKRVIESCAQIATCGFASEPVWRAGLSVLRLCRNAKEACHAVSSLDPKQYDPEAVDAKLAVLDAQHGPEGMPTSCQTFNFLRPDVCTRCPHWGRALRGELKTPLQLGDPPPAPLVVDSVAPPPSLNGQAYPKLNGEHSSTIMGMNGHGSLNGSYSTTTHISAPAQPIVYASGVVASTFPMMSSVTASHGSTASPLKQPLWLPAAVIDRLANKEVPTPEGKFRVITPGMAANPEEIGTKFTYPVDKALTEDGEPVMKTVYISRDCIVPIGIMKAPDMNGNLVYSTIWRAYIHGQKGWHEVVLSDTDIYAQDVVRRLSGHGVKVENAAYHKAMGEYVRGMLTAAYSSLEAIDRPEHVGWLDNDTFALGKYIYRYVAPGQTEVLAAPHNDATASVTRRLHVDGDFEKWRAAYNVFAKPGQEHMALASFVTWGAPLLRFTGCPGLTLLLYSDKSGHGKSTLQRVSAGAWGSPDMVTQLLGSSAGTTQAAFMSTLAINHSLPTFVDETSDMTSEQIYTLLYSVNSGEERRRSDPTGRVKGAVGKWRTLCLMSSNRSMRELLTFGVKEHDALLKRLIEIKVPSSRSPSWLEDTDILDAVRDNHFGHAGQIFAQVMVANNHQLSERVQAKVKELKLRGNADQSERFWFAAIGAMIVGAEIAQAAGLHSIDVRKIEEYFLTEVLPDQRRTSAETVLDGQSLLSQFFADNLRATLAVRAHAVPKSLQTSYLIRQPSHGAPLYIRAELAEQRAFISITALRDWCRRNNMSFEAFLTALQDSGQLLSIEDRVRLGAGVAELLTVASAGQQMRVVTVKIEPTDIVLLPETMAAPMENPPTAARVAAQFRQVGPQIAK